MTPEQREAHNRELIESVQPKFQEVSEKDKFYQLFDKMRSIQTGLEHGVDSQHFEKNVDYLIGTTKSLAREIAQVKVKGDIRADEELLNFVISLHTLVERLSENFLGLKQFQREVKEEKMAKEDILWRIAAVEECKRNITSLSRLFENLPPRKQMSSARLRRWFRPPVIGSLAGFITALGLVFALKNDPKETSISEKAIPMQGEDFESSEVVESFEEGFGSSEIPESFEEGTEQGEGNINGEGEPGIFKNGNFVGEVEGLRGFTVPSLWVSSVSTRFPDGKFRTVKRDTQMPVGEWKEDAQLKVEYFKKKVQRGETITLLNPVGYKINWEIDVKPGDDIFTHKQNRITFSQDAEITVQYFLHESPEDFSLPELRPLVGNYSIEYQQALQSLRSNQDPQTVLENYFGDFTYVVSSELGRLLQPLPGTFSEKISSMKIGDCDTMSNHANGLFTDAQKESVVATGILKQENKLDAARHHARFVYKDGDGHWQEYELTSLAKDAYVNVKFLAEDKILLQEKAREISGISDPELLQAKYKELGELLRTILSQEEYKKYQAQNGQRDSQNELTPGEKEFVKSIEEVIESFKGFFKNLDWLVAFGMAVGGLVTLSYLRKKSFTALEKKSYKRQRKIVEGQLNDIIQILSEVSGEDMKPVLSEKSKAQVGERIFESLKWFQDSFNLVGDNSVDKNGQPKMSLEQIQRLTDEQQKMFLLFLCSTKIIIEKPYRMIRLIALFREKLKWKEFMEDIRKTGINLENLVETLRKELNNPKQEKKFLLQVEAQTKDIMKRGAQKVPSLHRSPQAPVPTLLQIFSELGVDRLDDLKVQNKPGEGHELYEIRNYNFGDDPKRINWKATARTGRTITNVMAQEKEVGKKSANRFNVVIDVPTIGERDLECLVGLLHVAQREPQTLQIGDICFTAHGRAIDQWKAETIRQLVQKGKPENIQVLVKRVLEMQIKESIGNPLIFVTPGTRDYKMDDINTSTRIIPLRLSLKGKSIVFGSARLERETKDDVQFIVQGGDIGPDERFDRASVD